MHLPSYNLSFGLHGRRERADHITPGCASFYHSAGTVTSNVYLVLEACVMRKGILTWLSVVLGLLLSCCAALAVETSDQALFSAVSPDAMIVLDLSSSMRWNPRGDMQTSGEPKNRYGNDTCSGETSPTPPSRATQPTAPAISLPSGRSTRSWTTTRTG